MILNQRQKVENAVAYLRRSIGVLIKLARANVDLQAARAP